MKTIEQIRTMYQDCDRDDVMLRIRNRAARLARLADLNAPMIVIEAEFGLVHEVILALRFMEA